MEIHKNIVIHLILNNISSRSRKWKIINELNKRNTISNYGGNKKRKKFRSSDFTDNPVSDSFSRIKEKAYSMRKDSVGIFVKGEFNLANAGFGLSYSGGHLAR